MTTDGGHAYLDDHQLAGDEMVSDLAERVAALRPIPEGRERNGIALVKEQGLNVVLTVIARGAELSEHAIRGAASIQVLDGAVRLHAGGREEVLPAGRIAVVKAGVPHSLTATEESALLITVAMTGED